MRCFETQNKWMARTVLAWCLYVSREESLERMHIVLCLHIRDCAAYYFYMLDYVYDQHTFTLKQAG